MRALLVLVAVLGAESTASSGFIDLGAVVGDVLGSTVVSGKARGDDGGDSITFSDPAAVPSWEDAMPRRGYIMPYKTHGTHTCEHNVTQEVLLLRGSAVAGNARSGLLNFDICSGTVSSCPCRPRSRFQFNHHPGPDRPP